MNTKTRLQKAVHAYMQRNRETTIKLYVIFPDFVTHNGEKITPAEYDTQPKGDNDTVLNVHQDDSENNE